MAKPVPADVRPRVLALELWGVGDVALAIPFLRAASQHAEVTLLAKPHAAPLLRRFAPGVSLLPLVAPWTAFRAKYRLWSWPWLELRAAARGLRTGFDCAVSARPDPRDHALLRLSGARRRLGFARAGSGILLTDRLEPPANPHRSAHWQSLAQALGWTVPPPVDARPGPARRVVIHTGAAQPVRNWPRERYEQLAGRLRGAGLDVTLVDDGGRDLDQLLDLLASADAFVGNDSGPGHLAALLGVPTFTLFGPQLPERFHPIHPRAAWLPGGSCPHKPCFDACRFAEPHCLLANSVDAAWPALQRWLRIAA